MADGSHDPKALRAAIGISHADEKRIAQELSPAVAWPTLFLAVLFPATLITVIVLGFTGVWPLWACTPCSIAGRKRRALPRSRKAASFMSTGAGAWWARISATPR